MLALLFKSPGETQLQVYVIKKMQLTEQRYDGQKVSAVDHWPFKEHITLWKFTAAMGTRLRS